MICTWRLILDLLFDIEVANIQLEVHSWERGRSHRRSVWWVWGCVKWLSCTYGLKLANFGSCLIVQQCYHATIQVICTECNLSDDSESYSRTLHQSWTVEMNSSSTISPWMPEKMMTMSWLHSWSALFSFCVQVLFKTVTLTNYLIAVDLLQHFKGLNHALPESDQKWM